MCNIVTDDKVKQTWLYDCLIQCSSLRKTLSWKMHAYSSLCSTPAAADFTILTSISLFIRSTSSVNCCVRIFSFTRSCTKTINAFTTDIIVVCICIRVANSTMSYRLFETQKVRPKGPRVQGGTLDGVLGEEVASSRPHQLGVWGLGL